MSGEAKTLGLANLADIVPVGIRNPSAWLQRKGQRADRRPRRVEYPALEPGHGILARRRHHGESDIVIRREAHAKPRSKYAK